MSTSINQDESISPIIIGDLTIDDIISRVHESFSSRNRERISHDDVARIVYELDFSEQRVPDRAPRISIRRLKFTGEKRLENKVIPLHYDQEFSSGVNVILIPKNAAGKSSILKTIKFALTGDNDEYDVDVKKWITCIWLVFELGSVPYTILISTSGEARAVLIAGENTRPIADVAETTEYVFFDAYGLPKIQSELQDFFFEKLGLKKLAWTQKVPDELGAAERTATWRTYFQGLTIPDSSDQYLICDQKHAHGNQEGLIISTFLGLQYSEMLNRFGVAANLARKQKEAQAHRSDEEKTRLQQTIDERETKIREYQQALNRLRVQIQARRSEVEDGEVAQKLVAAHDAIIQKTSTLSSLEKERERLTEEIRRKRAAAQLYREKAQLQLHFTGLNVTTCPNCDAGVDSDAIAQEQHTHQCRLCGKPAHEADPSEVAMLEAEAQDIENKAQRDDGERTHVTDRLKQLRIEIEQLENQIESLQQASQQGIAYAQPTPDEDDQQTKLLIAIGRLQAEREQAQREYDTQQPDTEALDMQQRVLEKIKDVVREEADRLNTALLKDFCELTTEIAQRIGAESINNMKCSALGKVALYKYGDTVSFKSINNEGERLRIKLAFFLALMQVAQTPHGGHHPRLLLIDQPGSAEMVTEDFQQLVAGFRQIDEQLGSNVQIICCTARTEADQATASSKIYDPQAPPYAF